MNNRFHVRDDQFVCDKNRGISNDNFHVRDDQFVRDENRNLSNMRDGNFHVRNDNQSAREENRDFANVCAGNRNVYGDNCYNRYEDPFARHGGGNMNPDYRNAYQPYMLRQNAKDLPKFDGNPDDWLLFRTQFYSSTKMCNVSESENLMRLQRALSGQAREAVKALLELPQNMNAIMEMLHVRFGRDEYIIKNLIKRTNRRVRLIRLDCAKGRPAIFHN